MNRGVLQSSPVQQLMAAGSPNWWNINNNMRPPPSQHSPPLLPPPYNNHFTQYAPPPPPPPPSSSWLHNNSQEVLPESWSQLLMGGQVVEDVDRLGLSHISQHDQVKKLENWEEELLHQQVLQQAAASVDHSLHDDIVKQENSSNTTYNNHHHHHVFGSSSTAEFQSASKPTWPQMMPLSSPKSCVSSNMLDFSNTNTSTGTRHHLSDRSSECNSTATGGGAAKKARVQTSSSSTQPTFKVRKEKLGDRITALHQLVSPFGKTDTASVLLEAIGYIRFLQSQIEALSLPYLGSGSGNNMRQHQSVQGERNCLFPEDPGQLVNDNNCLKRKTTPDQETINAIEMKDLKSRGLCLVPISCTAQVESDNGADYWGPAAALGAGCFH